MCIYKYIYVYINIYIYIKLFFHIQNCGENLRFLAVPGEIKMDGRIAVGQLQELTLIGCSGIKQLFTVYYLSVIILNIQEYRLFIY